jgi:hypothetical protein
MAAATCPVCGWDITEDGKREVRLLDGKTVTVCCDECAGAVRTEPTKYAR